MEAASAWLATKERPLLAQDEEPLTYKEAMKGPCAKQWKTAGDKEISDLEAMKTFERVKISDVPKGIKILSTRMIYKLKKNLQGEIQRYKARCVVRGYEQEEGIDFDETFAAVVKAMSFKTLFAIVAHKDYDCEQADIPTAFLNSFLGQTVYCWPPEGYDEGYIWLLKRALYGLKQSPREWYSTLKEFLASLDFQHINADHSLFVNRKTNLIVAVYVDDLLFVGPKGTNHIKELKGALKKKFRMTDLGPVHQYLGMEVTRDGANNILHLSKRSYIEKVLTRFNMNDCRPVKTPMDHQPSPPDPGYQAPKAEIRYYQSIIGSLMYAMVETRPGIAFAVGRLSQFNTNPTEQHLKAVKHVLRYLKGTLDLGITYGGNDSLLGYTDADWAGDLERRKSTGGYLFTLYGGAVSWSSKRQTTVALSSCEAEYMAQTQSSKEAISNNRLIKELDLDGSLTANGPIKIRADNQGAIHLSKDPKYHSRTKHIDVQWHYVRDQVESGAVDFEYCPTDHMAADGLTKPLERVKFQRFVYMVGLRPN